ncbi:YveK family protein [Paenibacillus senegalensis]|uniref:YveK family protein n=1 Tax=Paenibacillus senegalensis TaxID=1465766 RepID=UPI000289D4AB|nr:Wzz/FepE/Etk N-terminal domain-containing protein [Paenibacillus senegalensis]
MELDLRTYLKVIQKRIWLLVGIVFLSCAATAVVSYFFIQPEYQASTKLIVNQSNDRIGLDSLDLNQINMNLRLIETYKEIIKTPAIMDIVVRENPHFDLSASELIQKVKISSVNNTQVMTLQIQDASQEKAAEMVNAISKTFQQEIPKIMRVDNVSILNEAKVQDHPTPVSPNPPLNLAVSFVVSLMIALGLIFLLEYLDDTIKTENDVQQVLGLPVLSIIPKIKQEDLSSVKESESTIQSKKQAGEHSNVTLNG